MYEFPQAILEILDEYRDKEIKILNNDDGEYSLQNWVKLKLEYHAKIVTPYFEEFLGKVYDQCYSVLESRPAYFIISEMIPQLEEDFRCKKLADLMFLDLGFINDNDQIDLIIEGLAQMDFYNGRDLPVHLIDRDLRSICGEFIR